MPWFGLAGMLLTILFLPDTTGLDLKEQERRWQFIRAGREHEYHGVAVHPKHLSLWERMRGVGRYYNAEADYRQKIDELRQEWELEQERRQQEKGGRADFDDFEAEGDAGWNPQIHNYFAGAHRSPDSTSFVKEHPAEITEKYN